SSRKLSGRWCHRSKFTVSIVICPTGLDVQFSLPALVKNSSSQDGRGLTSLKLYAIALDNALSLTGFKISKPRN
ncbi:MAG: hypothetical protein AAFX78_16450, partial [Cyanobacteria bacterium J06638_20]